MTLSARRPIILPLRLGVEPSGKKVAPAPSYDPDAVIAFARMTVQPDAARKAAYSTFITTLKSKGWWQFLDMVYLLAAHDAQASRVNLVGDLGDLMAISSPIFTANTGYAGDGAGAHLTTNVLLPALTKMGDNSSFQYLSHNTPALVSSSSKWAYGQDVYGNSIGMTTGVNVGARVNGATAITIAPLTSPRRYTLARNVLNNCRGYKDGAFVVNSVQTTGGRTSGRIVLLKTGPAANLASDIRLSTFILGGAPATDELCDQMTADIDAAVLTYLTAIGAPH